MSDYPAGVYSPRTKENAPSIVYDADQTTRLYSEDVVKLDDEVVAIETELGTDPKGADASVKARLDRVDVSLGELEDLTERVVKTADQTVNNSSAYIEDTELKIWVPANKFISFELTMIVDIKALSDLKFRFTGPNRYSWGMFALAYKRLSDTPYSLSTATVLNHTSDKKIFGSVFVVLQNGDTAGYIVLEWAQNTATAENTTVMAGSCITNIVRL